MYESKVGLFVLIHIVFLNLSYDENCVTIITQPPGIYPPAYRHISRVVFRCTHFWFMCRSTPPQLANFFASDGYKHIVVNQIGLFFLSGCSNWFSMMHANLFLFRRFSVLHGEKREEVLRKTGYGCFIKGMLLLLLSLFCYLLRVS